MDNTNQIFHLISTWTHHGANQSAQNHFTDWRPGINVCYHIISHEWSSFPKYYQTLPLNLLLLSYLSPSKEPPVFTDVTGINHQFNEILSGGWVAEHISGQRSREKKNRCYENKA